MCTAEWIECRADAVRLVKRVARAANAAEASGKSDWKLCWEACRLWSVASGLARRADTRADDERMAWVWARKSLDAKPSRGEESS